MPSSSLTPFPELPRDRHVRRTGPDYAQQFMRLLPKGQAWDAARAIDSTAGLTIAGLCDYWGWVDGRAGDLLEVESDPRKANDVSYEYPPGSGIIVQDGLLDEWERAWGLPDPCFPTATTIQQRRDMLILYMTWLGGQSREYYKKLMHLVGLEVSYFGEYAPFMAGISECGDTRPTKLDGDGNVVPDNSKQYRWYIGPPEQRFYWFVNVSQRTLTWFRAGSGEAGVDHHLEIGVPEDMQCLLNRWRPAHTELVFNFNDIGTTDPMAGTP